MSAAVALTGVERKHQYQTLIYQDPFYNRLYNPNKFQYIHLSYHYEFQA